MKLKRLKECHPRYDAKRLRILKALYKGGDALLGDAIVLQEIFPRYMHESELVYSERCKRAFYEPIFGQVINQFSAHLAQDPLTLEAEQDEESGEELIELDEYWREIQNDAVAIGEQKRSLDQVIRDVAVEGMICGWSWVQVDLPNTNPTVELEPIVTESTDELAESLTTESLTREMSLLEQEESGALRAYFIPWATEAVTDWEEKTGEILWVRTYQLECRSDDPEQSREVKRHVWTIWSSVGWKKYVIEETKDKPYPQNEEEEIPVDSEGTHTFGRVPWVRFDTYQKQGLNLHVGDAIKSLVVAYFNRTNGESFQWTQYCYQQLYEFLGPEVPGIDSEISDSQQDPARAKRTRSPGQVHVRGSEDRAEFIGPNMAGADSGRAATQDIRDAILRVISMMALSQDTSGAMLRRSADSKHQDSVAQEVLVGAVGKILVPFAKDTVSLAADVRGDSEPPCVEGYQNFDTTDPDAVINRAAIVESLTIESATYQKTRKYETAVADLGDAATPEIRQAIRDELDQAITQDTIMEAAAPLPPPEFDEFGNPITLEEEEIDEVEEPVNPFPPPKRGRPKKGGAKKRNQEY